MALTRSLLALTADAQGHILQTFAGCTPSAWAAEHISRRYGYAPPQQGDGPGHPARVCFNLLMEEFRTVSSWFCDGQLSPLLMGRHMATIRRGPLGTGYSWDFRDNGDVDPCMIQFKSSMIAATRTLEALPEAKRVPDNLTVISVANLVRDAHRTRASTHNWRAVEAVNRITEEESETVVRITGGELCSRWITFRTFSFLVNWVHDHDWCWVASKGNDAFGPMDDFSLKAER